MIRIKYFPLQWQVELYFRLCILHFFYCFSSNMWCQIIHISKTFPSIYCRYFTIQLKPSFIKNFTFKNLVHFFLPSFSHKLEPLGTYALLFEVHIPFYVSITISSIRNFPVSFTRWNLLLQNLIYEKVKIFPN